jgi:hypothetical protein
MCVLELCREKSQLKALQQEQEMKPVSHPKPGMVLASYGCARRGQFG